MRLLILLMLSLLSPGSARAAIEFAGYMKVAGERPRFVLVDTSDRSDRKASGWMVIGQVFKAHTLIAFDPKQEVLTLRKGEAVVKLSLNASRPTGESTEVRTWLEGSMQPIRDFPVSRW